MNRKDSSRAPRSMPQGKRRQRSVFSADEGRLWVDTWTGLEEYLKAAPNMLQTIEVQAGFEQKLRDLLKLHGSQLKPVITTELASAIRAEIKVPIYSELDFLSAVDASKEKYQLILALDQITDTRNLGAIARSAAYFGVPWIVMPKDRQASVTNATIRTGQGAFAFVRIAQVTNLSRSLKELKDRGYWVIGTDMGGEPVADIVGQYDKSVLVMGSEDRGMRELTRRNCDRITAIPASGKGVESLNVSVAAGIFLQQLSPRGN